MLGKTHVVGSLAAAHAGLLIYAMNQPIAELAAADVPIVGATLPASPVSLVTYGLVMTTVLLFVLLLLRVGSWRALTAYSVVGSLVLAGLYFVPSTTDGFQLATIIMAFALGSLLPDIDSEKSTIGRYFGPISKSIPHRTITHTIWAVAFIAGLGWYFDSVHVLVLAAGYALHILQDTFSRQGIAWFYPIFGGYDHFGSGTVMKKGRKPKLAYRTGGTGETTLFYGSLVAHLVCIGLVLWMGYGLF